MLPCVALLLLLRVCITVGRDGVYVCDGFGGRERLIGTHARRTDGPR